MYTYFLPASNGIVVVCLRLTSVGESIGLDGNGQMGLKAIEVVSKSKAKAGETDVHLYRSRLAPSSVILCPSFV